MTEPQTTLPTVRDILIAARARIADPKHWTQGASARDKDGLVLRFDARNAQSWCMMGALEAESGDASDMLSPSFKIHRLLSDVCVDLYSGPITYVNDILGHAAVMAVYDEAIRRAEAQETH